ncbi:hypothetical protein GCM10011494_24360 [Novosphingobium endophyticum]|uniref:Uncharacterized protein n=1 Tax=Novosphingobium endophyticum TaxID=1955250 RepID=A0A916TTJ8_9SPHN|nr:hypothetical protein GCM10011494_24360 [Novosphingobium endophyticum]
MLDLGLRAEAFAHCRPVGRTAYRNDCGMRRRADPPYVQVNDRGVTSRIVVSTLFLDEVTVRSVEHDR